MEIIWILIPFAILLAGLFIYGFFWMVNNGQYDDLDSPQLRMLLDEKIKNQNKNHNINQPNSNKERK